MKSCSKCTEVKPLAEFYKSSMGRGGYYAHCKVCHNAMSKRWAPKDVELFRQKGTENKRKQRTNPDFKVAERLANRQWSLRNPEKRREVDIRAGRLWSARNPAKVNSKNSRRRMAERRATPAWANRADIVDAYKEAQHLGLQVDHIVPLRSPMVCGLHVWANLQLISATANQKKGNRHWPDMPDPAA